MASPDDGPDAPYMGQAQLPTLTPEFLAQHYPRSVGVVHVDMVNRHGDRTPAAHFIPEVAPKHWNFCALGNRLHQDFLKAVGLHARGPASIPARGPASGGDGAKYDGKWQIQIFENTSQSDGSSILAAAGTTAQHISDTSRPTAATCSFGQLTDMGRQNMTTLGAHIRSLYVDALGFLPATRQAGDSVADPLHLRSTSYTRTLESLHHVLGGLYPNVAAEEPVYRITTRSPERDNMLPDFGCANLVRQFLKLNAMSLSRHAHEREQLAQDLRNIPGFRGFLDAEAKAGSKRSAITLMDTLVPMRTHGLPLPDGIDDVFLGRLARMAAAEYLHSGWMSAAVTRMQLGPMVHELTGNIVRAVEADRSKGQTPGPQLGIYSGHDATVAGLLAALCHDPAQRSRGAPAGYAWPPFSSSLRIELLRDATTPSPATRPAWEHGQASANTTPALVPPDNRVRPANVPDSLYRRSPGVGPSAQTNPRALRDYYVRVWYNDRALLLPACRDPGAHHVGLGPAACTLDGFFKQVARFSVGGGERRRECSVPAS
ncbi:hypothetical protein LPJ61_000781 [Coemansia biformis]|uniref:Phosphoglycerate mutase-like protein n=1 Tax=Coemansia biformis TaxID=1286918 RepID=A0A9W7YI10_9FUNG|nr:hypothetical protein LPJ61_000781 [Coemansia biformis]